MDFTISIASYSSINLLLILIIILIAYFKVDSRERGRTYPYLPTEE